MTSENQERPEIYANTHHLPSHLHSDGAQTPRQLEHALGDVDQIRSEQIEEWVRWSTDNGVH